jgi:hypothetical protein
MTWEQDRIVGNLRQFLRKAFVQCERIAARKVGATASFKKQRVARNQCAVEHEALATRGMTWRVNELNRDIANHHDVATAMRHKISSRQVGHFADVFGFFGLHVNWNRHDVE